ncbi:hypothetical protein CO613_02715 [Lysobacteraceae bacterium NML07-0707]|nr:hypothetical protein CO613_02715 [Xanthomonadaceae bacterium NML07-0707]
MRVCPAAIGREERRAPRVAGRVSQGRFFASFLLKKGGALPGAYPGIERMAMAEIISSMAGQVRSFGRYLLAARRLRTGRRVNSNSQQQQSGWQSIGCKQRKWSCA